MKISASIYSNNDRSLEILIQDLDKYNVDMFHVDFNDKKIEIKKIQEDIERIFNKSVLLLKSKLLKIFPGSIGFK